MRKLELGPEKECKEHKNGYIHMDNVTLSENNFI